MGKYSLGVDDAAGVRMQCFTISMQLHAKDEPPATAEKVLEDALAIEKYLFGGMTADEKEVAATTAELAVR